MRLRRPPSNRITVQKQQCNHNAKRTVEQILFASLFLVLCLGVPGASSSQGSIDKILHGLQAWGFKGSVHPYRQGAYEHYRKVQNGACNVLYPLVIIRPANARDVAAGIKVARAVGIDISVRSGGHGYTCNNIKNGSLHFDLRRLNKVELIRVPYQKTLARLGPGSKWSRVMKIISPKKYTIVHGQCTDVGVGGYLLGNGVNVAGSATRHGLGGENVVEYQMVDAEGDLVTVNQHSVTKRTIDGHQITSVPSEEENDLYFALKGAGSNFGIVTEFLVKVHPHPETKPALVFIFFRSVHDFMKLQKLSDSGRFQISAYRIQHFRKLDGTLDNIQNSALVTIVQNLRRHHRSPLEPMVTLFTDLHSKSEHTNLNRVLAAVRHVRLKNALPSALGVDRWLSKLIGLDRYDPNWPNYDMLYLSERERERMGKQAFTATSLMAAATPRVFEDIAFRDPVFDLHQDIMTLDKDIGCDACNWFFTIWSPKHHKIRFYANDRTREGTHETKWAFDFTCNYNYHDHYRAKRCKQTIDKVRYKLNEATQRNGDPLHHYYNTPSCHVLPNERPFAERYFGTSYEHLLRIKTRWDPHNVFNHCHSIGSTEEDCCVL